MSVFWSVFIEEVTFLPWLRLHFDDKVSVVRIPIRCHERGKLVEENDVLTGLLERDAGLSNDEIVQAHYELQAWLKI